MRLRSATAADLPAIVRLLADEQRATIGDVEYTEVDLRADWDRPGFEPSRDAVVAVAPDGALSGYAYYWDRPGDRGYCFAAVHPEHRGGGIGTALVDWTEDRARRSGRPVRLENAIWHDDEAARRLLSARGYDEVRHYWRMDRPLDGSERASPSPEGIAVRATAGDGDMRAVHDVIQESFAGHYNFTGEPYEDWHARVIAPDPSLVFVALDGAEAVGALVGRAYPDEGWVQQVGVRAAWRGRGIGACLLSHAFAAVAARGLPMVALSVDAGNETGAIALYERIGMRVALRWDYFERTVPV